MSAVFTELPEEAVERFADGLAAAQAADDPEPTAMTLSTRTAEGDVASRTVLLKHWDASGFQFFTNTQSNKGNQLSRDPHAALLFLWKGIQRQVQVQGEAQPLTAEEADAYFARRPRGSQIGAWASQQSRPLESREALEAAVARYEQKFAGNEVPRPDYWSGYRLRPTMIEFWYGRPFRLHDRFRFTLRDGDWERQRLYP